MRRLFATIADRYDLITVLLSYGRDRAWKRRLVAMSGVQRGTRALDLACGTGDIAFLLSGRGANVTGLDVTMRMLQLARAKRTQHPAPSTEHSALSTQHFVCADMMALPFPDASFELVTTGYGIRNVPQIEPAVAEIHRVLTPGGRFLSLDFDRPSGALLRGIYVGYLTVVGSALGWLLHRDPDTYRYIPETIKRYPGSRGVVAMLEGTGFVECRVVPLLGGFMAVIAATKPSITRLPDYPITRFPDNPIGSR